jgi:sporulation protein YlmC with PRC-barrel domain
MSLSMPTETTVVPKNNSVGETTSPEKTLTSAALVKGSIALLPRQEAGQVLSSKIVGASIYGMADEKIGDVNDLILNADGAIVGVVVGVGGFLGVGKKHVAVTYASIAQTKNDTGATHYMLQVTEEALQAAPAYEPATQN